MSSSYVRAECDHNAQPQHWAIELVITAAAIGYTAIAHWWAIGHVLVVLHWMFD